MANSLDSAVQDQLFIEARTANVWSDRKVPDGIWQQLYDLMKFGPTSANCSPARFVFNVTDAAKTRLASHVMDSNKPKILSSAATVIIGYDLAFADHLSKLFPHDQTAASWFADPEVAEMTAFRNGTLQGAYLMLAARTLGLDCGPMSGFDNGAVDADFFKGTQIKSNFICALGYGSSDGIFPRSPRLDFAEAVSVL